MAKKRHHASKHHLKGAAYLREHDEKRGPHGEFEAMHKAKHHSAHKGMKHHKKGHHHSPENHEGNAMDPWNFHQARMYENHEYYAGIEGKRHQEMEDAGMIREDHRAIANMPQQWYIREYPKVGPYMPEVIDDTIAGVDHQIDYDDHKRAMSFYPKKV